MRTVNMLSENLFLIIEIELYRVIYIFKSPSTFFVMVHILEMNDNACFVNVELLENTWCCVVAKQ